MMAKHWPLYQIIILFHQKNYLTNNNILSNDNNNNCLIHLNRIQNNIDIIDNSKKNMIIADIFSALISIFKFEMELSNLNKNNKEKIIPNYNNIHSNLPGLSKCFLINKDFLTKLK